MDDEYQIEYLNNLYIYRDSVLQMVEEGSYQYVIAYTPELLQQGRGEEAIEMLEVYHQKLSPHHEYRQCALFIKYSFCFSRCPVL